MTPGISFCINGFAASGADISGVGVSGFIVSCFGVPGFKESVFQQETTENDRMIDDNRSIEKGYLNIIVFRSILQLCIGFGAGLFISPANCVYD